MPPKSCYAILPKDGSGNILKVFQEITDEHSRFSTVIGVTH